jgi:2-amino-4-hydroxy-6-hydroxymethyldihydropteridine diphosphokinase
VARVFLSIGGNLGDRLANLHQAVVFLQELGQIHAISNIYETEPVGYRQQGWFLNGACEMTTELPPFSFLVSVKKIERRLGRLPSFANAPRVIDIDILLYDDLVCDSPTLTIPHPRMHERRFVLAPLSDIAGEVVHPLLGCSVQQLLAGLATTGEVRFYGPASLWFKPC